MPWGSVRLIPGVNLERTPTLLEAGYSASSLIRFRDGLAQKLGGWLKLFSSIPGLARDLHAWEDLNNVSRLAVGTTTKLEAITGSVNTDITPQTLTSDIAPNFSTVQGSATVTITDANISNVTTFDAVLLNTPIAVGGLILSGIYQIQTITGTHAYTITAASNATSTVNNGGAVPAFTTTNGSATVSVALTAHGLAVNNSVVFPKSTTGNGVTIAGLYTVVSVADANDFSIVVNNQATASSTFNMNGGNAEIVYYIQLGPPATGFGFGLGAGGFGGGGFGGIGGSSAQLGTQITATDWTQDNWGEILLSCPANGGIFTWNPTGGFFNAGILAANGAPPFNGGIFVSNGIQILVAWASTAIENIGLQQDPLLVKWSAQGDYTQWAPSATNQAGNFRIPIGSAIKAGLACPNQNLLWTDLDLWAMNYIGFPLVFAFNKIGAGAGVASSHAVQQLRGGTYWMGPTNFYSYINGSVTVTPCPVWDVVFQNINTTFLANVRSMPNTPFNEVGWLYPSAASTNGNCDSYVKYNIVEPGLPWDYGPIDRLAWTDQSVLGNPIGMASTGIIYQHEMTNDADGAALNASFTTGYFMIAEGEDQAFVDQFYPDMKWGTFAGSQNANVIFTFFVVNYPGDTPITYGPYTVTQSTQYIPLNIRGRQMAIQVSSSDIGSFWRLGRGRYRWSPAGRR